eukprot:3866232-Pleurochrysis_carterae.AAC.2
MNRSYKRPNETLPVPRNQKSRARRVKCITSKEKSGLTKCATEAHRPRRPPHVHLCRSACAICKQSHREEGKHCSRCALMQPPMTRAAQSTKGTTGWLSDRNVRGNRAAS